MLFSAISILPRVSSTQCGSFLKLSDILLIVQRNTEEFIETPKLLVVLFTASQRAAN
jgi:hypothetical protein